MLLLCPQFHGYEKEIEQAFTRIGFTVDSYLYDERRFIKYHLIRLPLVIFSLCIRGLLGPERGKIESLNRIKEWGKKYKQFHEEMRTFLLKLEKEYDFGLIVKGYGFDAELTEIFKRQIHGPSVLYQWDPILRFPSLLEVYKQLDKVITFQKEDATLVHNARYLPTFYLPVSIPPVDSFNRSNVIFVGEYTTARHKVLKKIAKMCVKNRISNNLLLVARFSVFHRINIEGMTVTKDFLPRQDVHFLYEKAGAIIDIPKVGQSGLTQRVYEALSSGRKVITTAKDCKHWPFYDSNWITTVDQFMINGHNWLMKKPDTAIDVNEYSIENWAKKVWHIASDKELVL